MVAGMYLLVISGIAVSAKRRILSCTVKRERKEWRSG